MNHSTTTGRPLLVYRNWPHSKNAQSVLRSVSNIGILQGLADMLSSRELREALLYVRKSRPKRCTVLRRGSLGRDGR